MFKAIFNKVEVSQGTKGTQALVHSIFKIPTLHGERGRCFAFHITSCVSEAHRQTDRHIDTVTFRQTGKQAGRQAVDRRQYLV